jgi:cytochrome c oxidase subunit 3
MAHEKNHPYHIIDPSPWPLLAAIGAITLLSGAVLWMHEITTVVMLIGLAIVLYSMFVWWRDVVHESRAGDHTPIVRIGLRMGFIMFIMSEVMFFSAWFWAFFKFSIFPMPAIEGQMVPTNTGPIGVFGPTEGQMFNPWDLPLINTVILLLSGCTVTWAHHELVEGKRSGLIWGLLATVFLGALFTIFQAYEYSHASFPFGTDVFGSTFFMATGFHGFHVIIGTIFLAVCLLRARMGDFTPRQHVGFEAAAWYWHFVDVVWLFLFACVYIWAFNVWGH